MSRDTNVGRERLRELAKEQEGSMLYGEPIESYSKQELIGAVALFAQWSRSRR